ncbi:MAG: DUF2189 domain-containing protein [Zoogloeaceae bacterium]|nr:DUF2189 domain-containing protein [Zoogloeaceae bacterium]MCP5294875.1 DUF2189 domain-containing protein [Zoogloeaceae bacterium]MCW5615495.1 DUF2189 domain-containing protein [Rhodocyclaceae bacterium]
MNIARPLPRRVSPAEIGPSLREGWKTLRAVGTPAYLLGGLFAFIGTLLIWGLQVAGLAPMTLPVVGGFLLVGPVSAAGFFGLSQAARGGSRPRLRDLLQGFRSASREVWVMALLCVFLFLIWITDAGTLYSFMIGERSHGLLAILPLTERTLHYVLGSGLMGAGLAAIVFVVTVHGVPLLIARRTALVGAVGSSVRAVFSGFVAHVLWGALMAAVVMVSIIVPPLLALVLPLFVYAGEAFHHRVFPVDENDQPPRGAEKVSLRTGDHGREDETED